MVKLSVVPDRSGKSEFVNIDVRDILFMCREHRLIEVVTKSGSYYTVGSLRFFYDHLTESGYYFKLIDKGVLVNVANIDGINRDTQTIYFAAAANRKDCTIASHRYKAVERELLRYSPGIAII